MRCKGGIKLRTIAILLAATATVTTTGCRASDPQTDDILTDYSTIELTTEEFEPLSADNFDSEAENIRKNMMSQGFEGKIAGIKPTLLCINAFEFSEKDGAAIFDLANETRLVSFSPSGVSSDTQRFLYDCVFMHNAAHCIDHKKTKNYIDFAQFTYNKNDRALVKYLDDLNRTLTELYADGNIQQMEAVFTFLTGFIENKVSVTVDGESLYLSDFSPTVTILLSDILNFPSTIVLRCDTDSEVMNGFSKVIDNTVLAALNDSLDKTHERLEALYSE